MFRGAKIAGFITGWQAYGFGVRRFYIVAPTDGLTETFDIGQAVDYCEMLKAAGVDPIYRASEPYFIP
jgi:hypothetical protein